ncbi:hypothetical protein tb265_39040 [Gemmatimonadetes bacterium T265]|nr:hypothetical protein tb265_39040 [Gemmatimonadetes bacterium T265]
MPGFFHLRFRADGLAEVRDVALTARQRVADLRPAFAVVAENLRAYQRRVFDTEGAALGSPWAPLAARTVAARTHGWGHYRLASTEGPARRVLHWTHGLRESLTADGADGAIASISATTLLFGTAVPYAAAANARRRFFDFPEAVQVTAMVQPVQRYLLGEDPRTGQGRRRSRRVGSPIADVGGTVVGVLRQALPDPLSEAAD